MTDPDLDGANRGTGDDAPAADGPHAMAGANDTFGLTPKLRVRAKPADPLLGSDLGGVRIVRLVGEGGMGRVYEARQERPERTVAVKVIRQGITSEKTLRRFEREAEFLAKLQHPGIAQIFVVGSYASDYGDVPFYVMEFIADAKPITNYCFEHDAPLAERLRLFAEVCDAVAHGHDRGIIHRDLKPGNILIDGFGRPRVIDFGVARSTDSDLALTSMRTDSGHLVGTAHYMSPEQFGPTPDDLDPRADIYALGVVLYELIAGVLPHEFGRKGIHEIARMVCEAPPSPLRRRGGAIPVDVEAIVAKCLEKDRRDRYHSAGDLAADLRRHLEGKPVRAGKRFLGPLGRLGRMLPRSRLAGGLILMAIAGIPVAAVTRSRPSVHHQTQTEHVDIGSEWVGTRLAVEQGACYRLVVTGQCIDDSGATFGPDGTCPILLRPTVGPMEYLPQRTRDTCLVGQDPIRAVIATIGDMAWTIHVGAGLTFIAPASGTVSLRINEPPDSRLNPRGSLAISLDHVPAPRFVDDAGRTSVYAQIDETDLLVIRPDGLQWVYGGSGGRVGMHEGVFPTLVNGIAWWPSWPDPVKSSLLATLDFEPVATGRKTLVIEDPESLHGLVSFGKPVSGVMRIRFSNSWGGSNDVGCDFLIRSDSLGGNAIAEDASDQEDVIPPIPAELEDPDRPIESEVFLSAPPPRDPNDFSSWQVVSGQWGVTAAGRIRGYGDAAIKWRFKQSWPAEVAFKMRVIEGMRPRVSLGSAELFIGSERLEREIGIVGNVSDLAGTPFRYELNKDYSVTLRKDGKRLLLLIDGAEVYSVTLAATPQEITPELRAGDDKSGGVVEFWDLRWSK